MPQKTQTTKQADWQRARSPAQKAQRRVEILSAAAQLFEEQGLNGVSLNAIANIVGLAKSNVYRYFATREEILLSLVSEDYGDFYTALAQRLELLKGTADPATVAEAVTATALERPRLCAFTAVLSSVIEQNISQEAFVAFKAQVVQVGHRLVESLCETLPTLSPQAGHEFLRYLQALASGLWPMSNATDKYDEVLKRPEFLHLRVEFAAHLQRGLFLVLLGLTS